MNVECCTIHKALKDLFAEHGFRAVRPQREMSEDRNANGAQDEDARRLARGKEKNVRCSSSPRRERERDTDDGT